MKGNNDCSGLMRDKQAMIVTNITDFIALEEIQRIMKDEEAWTNSRRRALQESEHYFRAIYRENK